MMGMVMARAMMIWSCLTQRRGQMSRATKCDLKHFQGWVSTCSMKLQLEYSKAFFCIDENGVVRERISHSILKRQHCHHDEGCGNGRKAGWWPRVDNCPLPPQGRPTVAAQPCPLCPPSPHCTHCTHRKHCTQCTF